MTTDNVKSIIGMMENNSEQSLFVTTETLRENDYVLNINRYQVDSTTVENGVLFDTVIKRITRGAPLKATDLDKLSSPVPTNKQYLMLSNIQNGIIDTNLPYLNEIDKKLDKYCLTHNCLILSKNGYPYKVAVAEVKMGQRVLANGNLYIIELDEQKIDPYYLAAFLGSERGIAALKSITVGASIPNIGVEQLKKLIIPLPPIEKQRRIAEHYQETRDEIMLLQMKIEKARNRLMHIFEEEA